LSSIHAEFASAHRLFDSERSEQEATYNAAIYVVIASTPYVALRTYNADHFTNTCSIGMTPMIRAGIRICGAMSNDED
jgi:hypothetical protein